MAMCFALICMPAGSTVFVSIFEYLERGKSAEIAVYYKLG
jgi:hypothetical protein